MSHDSMVSLQRFFIRQSRNETQKRRKLCIQCQHLKKENDKKTKKDTRWHSPFLFRGRWTGRCLVCKSIRVHAHTQAHSQFLIHRLDSQFFPGRWSEGALKFTCLLSVNLYTSTQCFSTFHRMTWQQPENLLVLVFHFTSGKTKTRATGSNSEKKFKPFTLDYWALSVAKLAASSPCLIVKHWYKILPLLFGSERLKTNKTLCFTIDFIGWTFLPFKLKRRCVRNILTDVVIYIIYIWPVICRHYKNTPNNKMGPGMQGALATAFSTVFKCSGVYCFSSHLQIWAVDKVMG